MKKTATTLLVLIYCIALSPTAFAQTAVGLPPGISAAQAANYIGVAAAVSGPVRLMQSGQVGNVIQSGQSIFIGDEISTGDEGRLQILLLDETVFTIGANTSMVIDEFVYDPKTNDGTIKAKIIKGVFRFITGKIAHKKPENMRVDLPEGSIGVRGTMVAGEASAGRSMVVLLGPGENNTTGQRAGAIDLSNTVNGEQHVTPVNRSGYGSEITGENQPPTPAFQVPLDVINGMMTRLAPEIPLAPQQQDDGEGTGQNEGGDNEGGDGHDGPGRTGGQNGEGGPHHSPGEGGGHGPEHGAGFDNFDGPGHPPPNFFDKGFHDINNFAQGQRDDDLSPIHKFVIDNAEIRQSDTVLLGSLHVEFDINMEKKTFGGPHSWIRGTDTATTPESYVFLLHEIDFEEGALGQDYTYGSTYGNVTSPQGQDVTFKLSHATFTIGPDGRSVILHTAEVVISDGRYGDVKHGNPLSTEIALEQVPLP